MSNRFSPSAIVAVVFSLMCAMGVLYVLSIVQTQVEQSVRRNFVAAGVLARMQLQGERMRRYEKEMFIYVGDAGKRAGYAKEFDGAAVGLLAEFDTALLPSGRSFDDAERKDIAAWRDAANFYVGQFEKLVVSARRLDDPAGLTPPGLKTTLDFNKAIEPGKDRFRELLKGADAMRVSKEKASMQIAKEIDREFFLLIVSVLGLAALGVITAVAWPHLGRLFHTAMGSSTDRAAPSIAR